LGETPAADQPSIGVGRDHREVRFPPAKGAVTEVPGREIHLLAERFRAARQEGTHREQEHLSQVWQIGQLILGARYVSDTTPTPVVPVLHQGFERVALARQGENLLVLAAVERIEAVEDVGRLPKREAEVRPFERDIAESDDGTAQALLLGDPCGFGLNPRERHARLHASLHFDEGELHVNGRRQVGLVGS
jgi:hypothetical protein